jgi:hypothetical protein
MILHDLIINFRKKTIHNLSLFFESIEEEHCLLMPDLLHDCYQMFSDLSFGQFGCQTAKDISLGMIN